MPRKPQAEKATETPTATVTPTKTPRETFTLDGGIGPDPLKLAEGKMNWNREGEVLKRVLNGDGDGTAKGILEYLTANRPENYQGKVQDATVKYLLRRAVEAKIIESRDVLGVKVYLPLENGPDFAKATKEGLAFRKRILSAVTPAPAKTAEGNGEVVKAPRGRRGGK